MSEKDRWIAEHADLIRQIQHARRREVTFDELANSLWMLWVCVRDIQERINCAGSH